MDGSSMAWHSWQVMDKSTYNPTHHEGFSSCCRGCTQDVLLLCLLQPSCMHRDMLDGCCWRGGLELVRVQAW